MSDRAKPKDTPLHVETLEISDGRKLCLFTFPDTASESGQDDGDDEGP